MRRLLLLLAAVLGAAARPFLVSGCGRGGTHFVADALRAAGLAVAHEEVPAAADGVVSWAYAAFAEHRGRAIAGESADSRARRSDPAFAFAPVLHVVRHPLAVISSLQTCFCLPTPDAALNAHFDRASWDFVAEHLPELPGADEPLARAMHYWLHWNRLVEAQSDAPPFRVEELDVAALAAAAGHPGVTAAAAALPPPVPREPTVSWADLKEAHPRLARAVWKMARRYGYDRQVPRRARPTFDEALALRAAGRTHDALQAFRACCDGHWAAVFHEGSALAQLGRPGEAAEAFARAARAEANPAPADAWANVGVMREREGDWDAAAAAFRAEIAAAPAQARGHLGLARALQARGDRPKRARNALRRALELEPDSADVHLAVGAAALELAGPDAAVRHYLRAIELDPAGSSPHAHNNLGFVLDRYSLSAPVVVDAAAADQSAACFAAGQAAKLAALNAAREAQGLCALELASMADARGAQELQAGGERYGFALAPENIRLSPSAEFDHAWFHEKRVVRVTLRDAAVQGHLVFGGACRLWLPTHAHHVQVEAGPPAPAADDVLLDEALFVGQLAGADYYHWMAEVLPRLLWSRRWLRKHPDAPIIAPRAPAPLVADALQRAGLAGRRVLFDGGPVYRVRRLRTVDWRATDRRPGMEFFPPRAALRLVRDVMADGPADGEDEGLIVLVSRAGAAERRPVNEPALEAALRRRLPGRRVVVFRGDDASPDEARRLFGAAAVVVGVHGGGLANVVFCRPGTRVVEAAVAEPIFRHYLHMAAALDLEWVPVPLPPNSFYSTELELDVEGMVSAVVGSSAVDVGRRE